MTALFGRLAMEIITKAEEIILTGQASSEETPIHVLKDRFSLFGHKFGFRFDIWHEA